jgi:polyisoprenoid-binding protein YceI
MIYQLGPENGHITVLTDRSGWAAFTGHRLTIDVGQWQATLDLGDDSYDPPKLTATIDATSLAVIDGVGGLKRITDGDRRQIARSIATKVLASGRFPTVTFESNSIDRTDAETWCVDGRLTLVGNRKPIRFAIDVGLDGELTARVPIVQEEFGIKPFSTMMRALRVPDPVEVTISVRVAALKSQVQSLRRP